MARFSFYNIQKWKRLRQYILQRDCICTECNFAKPTIAHHIIAVNDDNVNDPDIVWNPDNLRSVCQDCHNKIHHGEPNSSACVEGYEFNDAGELVKLDY